MNFNRNCSGETPGIQATVEKNDDRQFYADAQSQLNQEELERKEDGAVPREEATEKCQNTKARSVFENFEHERHPEIRVDGSNAKVQADERKDYVCSVCGECFAREKQFYGHLRSHSGEVRWRCELCPESSEASFASQSQLHRHENLGHSVVRPFECPECDMVFDRMSQRDYHRRSVHQKERSHVCPVCGKGFFRWSDVRTHLNIHVGNRWICEVCGREFNHVSNLIRHSRTHAGVKPYPCSVCGKRFSQLNTLTRHKAIHARGEDALKCHFCEKLYKGEKGLKEHMKKSHGFAQSTEDRNRIMKRQHHCKICGESFQFVQLLRQHEEHHQSTEHLDCGSCGKSFWKVEDIKEHSCAKPKAQRLKSKNVKRKSAASKDPGKVRIEDNENEMRVDTAGTDEKFEALRKKRRKHKVSQENADEVKSTKIQAEDSRSKDSAVFVTIRQMSRVEGNKRNETENSDSLFWREIPVFEISDSRKSEKMSIDSSARINLKEATLDPKNDLYFTHTIEMESSKEAQNRYLDFNLHREPLFFKSCNIQSNEKESFDASPVRMANMNSSEGVECNRRKDLYSFQSSEGIRFTNEETQPEGEPFNELTTGPELEQRLRNDLDNATIFTGTTPGPTLAMVQITTPDPKLQLVQIPEPTSLLVQRSTPIFKSSDRQNNEKKMNPQGAERNEKKDPYSFASSESNNSFANEKMQFRENHFNEFVASTELEQHFRNNLDNATIFTGTAPEPTLAMVQITTPDPNLQLIQRTGTPEPTSLLVQRSTPVLKLSDRQKNEKKMNPQGAERNEQKDPYFFASSEANNSFANEKTQFRADHFNEFTANTELEQHFHNNLDNATIFTEPTLQLAQRTTPEPTFLLVQSSITTLKSSNDQNKGEVNSLQEAERKQTENLYSFHSSESNRFTNESTQPEAEHFNEFTTGLGINEHLENTTIFTDPTLEPTLQLVQRTTPEPTLLLVQRTTPLLKSSNGQNNEKTIISSQDVERYQKEDLYSSQSSKGNIFTIEETQPEGEHFNEFTTSPELENLENATIFTDSTLEPTLQLVQRTTVEPTLQLVQRTTEEPTLLLVQRPTPLIKSSNGQSNEKKMNSSQEEERNEKKDLFYFQSSEENTFAIEETLHKGEHFNEFTADPELENTTVFTGSTPERPEPTLRLVQTENGQQFYELVMNNSPEKCQNVEKHRCETPTTNDREEHLLEPTLKLVQTENGQEFFELVRSASPDKPENSSTGTGFPGNQETQLLENFPVDAPGFAPEVFSRTSFENDVLRDIHAQENGAEQFFELVQEIVREDDVEQRQTERAPMLRLVQNEDGEQFFELVHGELGLDVVQEPTLVRTCEPSVAQSLQTRGDSGMDAPEDSGLFARTDGSIRADDTSKTSSLPRNRKQKSSGKEFRCEVCDKVFTKGYNYQQHRGTHFADQQKFKCQECGTCFAWKSTLNKHMATHKTDARQKFVCEICPKVYSTLTQVNEHVKRDHLKERNHKCPHCAKRFFKKFDLKTHIRTHTKERPYVCRTCGKSFHHLSHIIRHERIHSGEKPYACDICQRTFTQHGSLKIHRQRHEEIKIDILDYQMDEDEPLALTDL